MEFQRRLLAVTARDAKFALSYRTALDATYFTDKTQQLIAREVLAHFDKHRVAPSKALLLELCKATAPKDVIELVTEEVKQLYKLKLNDAAGVQELAVSFGQTQAVVNAVLRAADYIEEGKREKILPEMKAAMQVGQDVLDRGHDWVKDVAEREQWYLGNVNPRTLIPTGLKHVDAAMGGGLGVGEIGVLLSSPKGGKTSALVNMAYGAAIRGHNVAYYTLEVDKDVIAKRFDRRLMYRTPDLEESDVDQFIGKLRRKLVKIVRGRLVIKRYPANRVTADTIAAHLDLLHADDGFTPQVIIVDYAALLNPLKANDAKRLELNAVYTELRNLAMDRRAAVWTAAQSTTEGFEKETLNMADFAESRGIVAIVDAAWALCATRDEKVKRTCRFYACALRNADSDVTIEATFDRRNAHIKTTGLFDAAHMPKEVKNVKTKDSAAARDRRENGGKATRVKDRFRDRPRKGGLNVPRG